MNRDELARLVFITMKEHSFATDVQDALVAELWSVLERVYEEGVLSGYDHTNMPQCNPHREGYRFEDWHR